MWRPSPMTELIERLERALENEGDGAPLLVFDADGTLWSGDVGVDLFSTAIQEHLFRDDAIPALRREAEDCGVDSTGGAEEIALRLLTANERGEYENARAFGMMAWAFAGFEETEMTALARRVVRERRLDERVHAYVRPVLGWARAREIPVVVCSASPLAIVVAGVELLGIAPADVIAVTPEVVSGRLTARLVAGATPYGEGKVARVRERFAGARVLAGFGDTAGDAPFLRLASVAVAVEPHAKLRELLPTFREAVVIDRGEVRLAASS
jgi:phosphatidylglycerophosphatase C